MEAVRGEPGAVNAARACSNDASGGSYPAAPAMARHSSSTESINSLPPRDAMMSPMDARMRQVTLAKVARKTHLSHISCTMCPLSRASNPALARV